jgi:hypothetical protein
VETTLFREKEELHNLKMRVQTRLKNLFVKELEWMRRQPKARTTTKPVRMTL